MSETVEVAADPKEAEVSVDDLKRMLDEARGREESLKRERDDERATRQVAEAERDAASGRVATEAEQRWAAQKQAVDGSLAAADAEADRAEQAYAAAAESGDWAAASKAQRAIAAAAARGEQYRAQKDWLEKNKPAAEQARSAPTSGDKYSGIVQNLRPSEREWLDQRPQFMTDQRYRQRVFNASGLADAEGNVRGTPEYFARIEQLLGEGGSVQQQERQPARERPMSSDLAPQRRAAPNAEPRGGEQIRLTADQVEVADGLYGNPGSPDYIADPKERYRTYHANLERMRASGRM